MNNIINELQNRFLVLDGATGTQIQEIEIPQSVWGENEGCNEYLNKTLPDAIRKIHKDYCESGADIIKTNTFGAMDWVLDEYNIGHLAYELSYLGAKLAREAVDEHGGGKLVAGSIGPGTKLPSLGHIDYDTMYRGYKECAKGLIDGGIDIFLIETCQDPLQIKACLHGVEDIMRELHVKLPIMVSVTIEVSGAMLIGTDAQTIATIMEPFEILSLGFNCGTGPEQIYHHLKTLSSVWDGKISVHANAGLPQNRGGVTYYPMDELSFADEQLKFCEIAGVSILGGCCGTTPRHIKALVEAVVGKTPKPSSGLCIPSLASLYETRSLVQTPAPFLIGERSNATGSKAFRELLLNQDFEGILFVASEQIRSGAHGLDVSVGFAGRDEASDMSKIVSLYSQKTSLPLMVDSTQINALEAGLKAIGGKPIVNSVNLEDGIEKFDKICALAKRFGASLVCLAIDEQGMTKTAEQKIAVAVRMYERATTLHGFKPHDLVFDLLTFTIGSGDDEYRRAGIETIEAIKGVKKLYPEVGFVLGVSNISFGLQKNAREYLNSVFLHHCVEAGLSMAIVNVKNTLPLHKISDEDLAVCEALIFNDHTNGDPLFDFINHFDGKSADNSDVVDELDLLDTRQKIHKLLLSGDKPRMLQVLEGAKDEIEPEKIINECLIDAMKEVGELFGSGKMQLPFVLQSAEVMKSSVDFLNPFLPKKEKKAQTTLILGTVKGDVHDVGKNLVDIILTNNGFKVVNIGIKADISLYMEMIKEHNPDFLGMSGLLVKSTAVMRENLEYLKSQGISLPVMLGGAALNEQFVEEYCRPVYDGAIFYCRDAFDSIEAMSRVERGDYNTDLGYKKVVKVEVEETEVKEVKLEPLVRDFKTITPPFWGRRELKSEAIKQLSYEWINHKILFSQRWGYSPKGLSKEERQKQNDEVLWPLYEKTKLIADKLYDPTIIYGYWPCRRVGEKLYIFPAECGWSDEPNVTPLEKALHVLEFPRQKKGSKWCLSDFYDDQKDDVVAFSCVSAGRGFSEYEGELYEQSRYKEYFEIHGLSVELAEALAEVVHKQYRLDMNIATNEGKRLQDVQMRSYQGCRFSFGYPACPELSQSQVIFDLLEPERFGIELSENFLIVPEQSTTAMIAYHPQAKYFTVW